MSDEDLGWIEDPAWTKVKHGVGSVVVAAGQLENTIECLALNLLNPGTAWNRTLLVVADMQTSHMAERVRRLAHFVIEEADPLLVDLCDWLDRVQKLQAERNDLMHSHWSSNTLTAEGPTNAPTAHTTNVRRPKAGVDRRVRVRTADELRDLAGRISLADIDGGILQMELQELAHAELQHPDYGLNGQSLPKWRRVAKPDVGLDRT